MHFLVYDMRSNQFSLLRASVRLQLDGFILEQQRVLIAMIAAVVLINVSPVLRGGKGCEY